MEDQKGRLDEYTKSYGSFLKNKIPYNFISIVNKIITVSKCYDAILLFGNDGEIKVHKLILKNIQYFHFISDSNELEIIDVINLKYDVMKILLEYLYTKNFKEVDKINFVDMLILADYIIINDDNTMDTICTFCANYLNVYPSLFFKNDDFNECLQKLYRVIVIFTKYKKLYTSLYESIYKELLKCETYDINVFVNSLFFIKYFSRNSLGIRFIINNKIFALMENAMYVYNMDEIFNIVIHNKPPNMWKLFEILLGFGKMKFNILLEKHNVPIEIFDHPNIYDNLSYTKKIEIIMHHKNIVN
jgi:hypothetical protein